ncbi:MAG: hypothetical protein SFW67_17560, partial [Myxococcaceae bacterium]|nr:hypothetical protein [Myxococcaceae bacterium]
GPLLNPNAPFGLGLLACSATKAAVAAPAAQLYQGHTFKLALELAQRLCQRIRILSGFHGVLRLDTTISPYERPLTGLAKAERLAWAARVASSLAPWAHDSVLCLAPASYWHLLPDTASWVKPLMGLGLGAQKAALKAFLADASTLVPSSGRR